jgi:repressor LexA
MPEATMPTPLTDLERRVLDYLIEYLRQNTYQPSIREIGQQFSIKSTKTVSELLQSLADKGWIERDPSRSRGVRLLGLPRGQDTVSVPLSTDAVLAADALVLDRRLAGGAGAYLLAFDGAHLVEHGIRQGDLLLIEPVATQDVDAGDLLVIRHGDRPGVRHCVEAGAELVLEPLPGEPAALRLAGRQAQGALQGRVTCVVRRIRAAATAPAVITAVEATA